jgi:hypothetical protein
LTVRFEITMDCPDPAALTDFWAEAVHAVTIERGDRYVILHPPEGEGVVPIVLQRVPEPKVGKARVHLDIYVDADVLEAEIERLVQLGATRVSTDVFTEDGEQWFVMADPVGNEFCLCS